MPMLASAGIAQVAIEAIRTQRRRAMVNRGWADPAVIDDRDDCLVVGEVDQQALFGRVAAVCTTAARALRRRPPGRARRRW
jgi:vancomycin aglycone glucosyltransferase